MQNRIVGQRAADLHARLRTDAGSGQPGDDRRPAGPLHSRPAAGLDGRTCASTQPSIYFGELSSNYALVKTKQQEFHYPTGDDNERTTYDGIGGVSIGGVLAAAAVRDPIHRHRHPVHEPADAGKPHPVLPANRGSRADCWRRSSRSTPIRIPCCPTAGCSGSRTRTRRAATIRTRRRRRSRARTINYIRNSVKVVIDAYHGSTTFYLAEPDDPLAQTLGKIFPGMLQAAVRRCRRTCAATCAIRRTFSRSRRRCIRPTT